MAKQALFAPLPIRAIGDSRLSGLDLRVLACIASQDRLSAMRGKGAGCYASHGTMSAEVGCHITRFSTSTHRLIELGYLNQEPHSLNKRMRAYRVVYEPNDSLPNGKRFLRGTDCEAANHAASAVCQPKSQAAEAAEETAANIFRKTEDLKYCEKSLAGDQEAVSAQSRLNQLIQRFAEGRIDISTAALEAFVSEIEALCAGSRTLEQRARETKQRAYRMIADLGDLDRRRRAAHV